MSRQPAVQGGNGTSFRVALVALPFGVTAQRPAIQLALLRALAEREGFVADTFHLYLELAAKLTPKVFDTLCSHRGSLTREWLFAVAAFGDQVPDEPAYFAAFPQQVDWAESAGLSVDYLSSLRRQVLPAYIDECLESVDWGQYALVGFSSTFQQQVASLALARRIKQRFPDVLIAFGGGNLEGEMGAEQARAFPFIDFVVVGEADATFASLLRALAAGDDPGDLPGLIRRTGAALRCTAQAPPLRNLDDLPIPVYDEFFERARRLGLLTSVVYGGGLPFESSRGCWYGEKHHCTFCGLSDFNMVYRSKSAERVLAEVGSLAARYRSYFFEATDEILNMKYLQDVFPKIQQTRMDLQFFFEAKANLTRPQLQQLYHGGVRWLQPGIESLSSHVLTLMRKGCTMLQNVRLLKWCRYYGIRVSWNLLWGFPGETEEDYRRELDVLRCLSHLQPPDGACRIRLDRFSPYFEDRRTFPVRDVRPAAGYRHIYPPHVDLDKAAYFFDHTMADTVAEAVHAPTLEWLREWQQNWGSSQPDALTYTRTPAAVTVTERRGGRRGVNHRLEGAWGMAYHFCSETMRTPAQLAEHLEKQPAGWTWSTEMLTAGLEDLCRKGLMVGESGQYLSLALPANPNW